MHIKRVLQHTKRAVLACCERAITFVPEIIWRVTNAYKYQKLSFLKSVLTTFAAHCSSPDSSEPKHGSVLFQK